MGDERRVSIRLDLKPGDANQLGRFMIDAMSTAGREASRSIEANRSVIEGMSRAGEEARRAALPEVSKVIPVLQKAGMLDKVFGGGLMQQVQTGGLGFLASRLGGQLGGAGGAALSLGGQGLMAGAAGFAAGGPIGAAIAMIPTAVEALKGLASAPFKMVSNGLDNMTNSMKELAGPLGPGGVFLGGLSNAAKQIPLVGDAIGGMVDSLKGFLEQGLGFVQMFSPGTAGRFGIVQQDTLATIGRTFAPIMESLTDFMRLAGDFLATILPGTGQMRDALSPLKDLFSELRSVLADVAPYIKQALVDGLFLLKTSLQLATYALRGFMEVLNFLTFGLIGGNQHALQSSAGMASRNISFQSPEAAAKSVYQAAFRAGAVGSGGVSKSTPELLLELIAGFKDGTFIIQTLQKLAGRAADSGAAAGAGLFVGGPLGGLLAHKAARAIERAR